MLATSCGEKFGKTAGNAVWLDAARTSPYQFYQYWIRTDDRDAERFLKLFTFLSNQEIAELCASPPEQRAAQKKLASEVTRIVHGEDSLALAMKASDVLFGGDMTGLHDRDLEDIFADVPSFIIEGFQLGLRNQGHRSPRGERRDKVEGRGREANRRRRGLSQQPAGRRSRHAAQRRTPRIGEHVGVARRKKELLPRQDETSNVASQAALVTSRTY